MLTKDYEIELNRTNVTPAEFMYAVRKRLIKEGLSLVASDMTIDYLTHTDLTFPLHYNEDAHCWEKSTGKPYEQQSYVRSDSGEVYNEICEFTFWDDKRGSGYFYMVNITDDSRDNAPESPAEAPTSPESPAVDETPAEAPKAPEIAVESPKAAGKEESGKPHNVRRISRGIGRIRKSSKYCGALQRKGNTKLTDYGNIRYAQFNTRALIDCPFKSAGCSEFCYANKGLHVMPSVKKSREKSHLESIREDFAARMIYAIHAEITHSRRYGGDNVMMCRIHESGDFFHIEYLRKWVKVWKWATRYARGKVVFPLYTKSTPLFNALSPEDRAAVNEAMRAGVLALNASYDDTYTAAAQKALARFLALYPLANVYIASNDDSHPHNHNCDCENCGKCGKCNHADARRTLVHIH